MEKDRKNITESTIELLKLKCNVNENWLFKNAKIGVDKLSKAKYNISIATVKSKKIWIVVCSRSLDSFFMFLLFRSLLYPPLRLPLNIHLLILLSALPFVMYVHSPHLHPVLLRLVAFRRKRC